MWSAITALLTIAAAILRHWYANSPNRKIKRQQAWRQKMRQAVVNGDADIVSRRIASLRRQNRLHRGQQPRRTVKNRPGRRI